MSDKEQARVFAKNLLEMLRITGKTQIEVANAVGVSQQTFNSWCRGIAYPRMGKVQMLADYFGVRKSALVEESAPAADPVLSDRDIALLEKYHSLNALGKDKLDERADELCEMEKYKKDAASSVKAG